MDARVMRTEESRISEVRRCGQSGREPNLEERVTGCVQYFGYTYSTLHCSLTRNIASEFRKSSRYTVANNVFTGV
jgi:hypothetical protein